MKVVLDTDLLSTLVRIKRIDLLNSLFDKIIIPQSVISELAHAEIRISDINFEIVKLTRIELLALKKLNVKLGKGERECLAIAKYRGVPLATSDKLVHLMCRKENVSYFTLPRLLRLAILKSAVSVKEARQIIRLIEHEERTVIKDKDEIFK